MPVNVKTGLIHDSSGKLIPLLDNFGYLFSLFRSHTVEKGVQGALLLDRLLHFQNKEGYFPNFIHDYPQNGSARVNSYILLVLQLLERRYSRVIEKGVRDSLERAIRIFPTFELPRRETSSEWAYHILASQLGEHITQCPVWHPELSVFCGAPYDERQFGGRVNHSLFPASLQALHLNPDSLACHVPDFARLGRDEWKWNIANTPETSFAEIEKFTPGPCPKGFHLLRYLFKNGLSFVLAPGNFTYEKGQFTLSDEMPDHRETMEINFYVSRDPSVTIQVEGEKATAFQAGEKVTILIGDHRVELVFDSEDQYYGHISYGNRPMELNEDKFASYDYRIGIRSVKRKPLSKLNVRLSCQSGAVDSYSHGVHAVVDV